MNIDSWNYNDFLNWSNNKYMDGSRAELVTYLDILGVFEVKISKKIKYLKNMQEFFSTSCYIKVLPTEFFMLKNLKIITLSDNSIETLPDALENLSELEYFDISCNQLKLLPPSIGKLKKLKYFDCGGNNISDFPNELCDLTELKYCVIGGNFNRDIPKEFENLQNLEYFESNTPVVKKLLFDVQKMPKLNTFCCCANNELKQYCFYSKKYEQIDYYFNTTYMNFVKKHDVRYIPNINDVIKH